MGSGRPRDSRSRRLGKDLRLPSQVKSQVPAESRRSNPKVGSTHAPSRPRASEPHGRRSLRQRRAHGGSRRPRDPGRRRRRRVPRARDHRVPARRPRAAQRVRAREPRGAEHAGPQDRHRVPGDRRIHRSHRRRGAQRRGAAAQRHRRGALPQGAASELRRLRRAALLRARRRRAPRSRSEASRSGCRCARTPGTTASPSPDTPGCR